MFLSLSPSTRLKGFVLKFIPIFINDLNNLLAIVTDCTSPSTVLVPLIGAFMIYTHQADITPTLH